MDRNLIFNVLYNCKAIGCTWCEMDGCGWIYGCESWAIKKVER